MQGFQSASKCAGRCYGRRAPHHEVTRDRILVAAILVLIAAVPARAQSSYITGAIGADLSNFGQSITDGEETIPPDGFAFGSAARVGTAFGERWGVEVEFASATTITREADSQNFGALLRGIPVSASFITFGFSFPGPDPTPPDFHVNVIRRNSTFNTLGWVSKELTEDVELAVLFGLGVRRTSFDIRLFSSRGTVRPNSAQASLFELAPVVGADLRFRIAQQWRFIPSTRLESLDSEGWLLRTTAGLSWMF